MNLAYKPRVAIVDYGMGNLFSVKNACDINGLEGIITFSPDEIHRADAVILPGVGAFGTAMKTLKRLHLRDAIKEAAFSGKPFIGICLGMQLLMERSYEFGEHEGLEIIRGKVVRFNSHVDNSGNIVKIPQAGWNTIYKADKVTSDVWKNSLCCDMADNEFMYFVHSYYVIPDDASLNLSMSQYGNIEFCSSLQYNNIFACQFHPERSGPEGLKIYKRLRYLLTNKLEGSECART